MIFKNSLVDATLPEMFNENHDRLMDDGRLYVPGIARAVGIWIDRLHFTFVSKMDAATAYSRLNVSCRMFQAQLIGISTTSTGLLSL